MMRAFVIKNKEGKMLCWHHIVGYYFDHFNIKSLFYMQFGTEKEIKAVFKNKEFDNTDCTIVPITICEGDLEEENRVLKKERELVKSVIQSIYNGGQTYCTLPNGKEIVGDMGYIIDFYANVCKNYPELKNIFGKQGDER